MTLSTELSFAILALDSYNRGYDAFVGVEGNSIGGLTILSQETLGIDPQTYTAWQNASFYAVAYQNAAGNIVISYRGTDAPFAGDITAWTGGAGFQTEQAGLAARFYYLVKQAQPDAEITLTGHSLGGGLVAQVTGSRAFIYDNMPDGHP